MKYQHIAMKFFFFPGWSAESIGYNTGDGKLYKGKGSFLHEYKNQGGEHSSMGGRGGGSYIFIYVQNKSKLGTHVHTDPNNIKIRKKTIFFTLHTTQSVKTSYLEG
jgi:hypothetical protein